MATPGKPKIKGGKTHGALRTRKKAGGPGRPPSLRKKRSDAGKRK